MRNKSRVDNCKECGNEFNHYPWDKQEYCSRGCYYKKDKVKCICEVCGVECLRSKSVSDRNSLNYCSRVCYDNRKKESLKRLKRNTKFYSQLLGSSSCECGETKIHLLQIHHIDGNHHNNEDSNLEIVCGNCHIKRHLKKRKDGKWVYHPKSLTSRDLLKYL